jgi:hypothetical protein
VGGKQAVVDIANLIEINVIKILFLLSRKHHNGSGS